MMRDGVDHINVYSKGETALGRFLSNFADSPFECEDGRFRSVEGYWYWLGAGGSPRRDELRSVCGFAAKALGRSLRAPDWQTGDEFKRKIAAAIRAKLEGRPDMLAALRGNRLPLRHYYVYGGKVVEPAGCEWILAAIEEVRNA